MKRFDSTLQDFTAIARIILIVGVPIILTIIAVRITMSPWFLAFQYTQAGLPPDIYGFTTQDRLRYAPPAVSYLLNGEDISYLGNLRLPRELVPIDCLVDDDNPSLCHMFNARELRHMEDVKVITINAYRLGIASVILSFFATVYLWRYDRQQLRQGILGGGLLTLGLIAAIIFLAATAWDVFFTGFHQLLFEGDSWLFYYSDTLIRLFPEQFWFNAAVFIGSLAIVSSALLVIVSWRWHPKRIQS